MTETPEVSRCLPELAALSTKTSKPPLIMSGNTWMPALVMATTNGDAADNQLLAFFDLDG